MKTLLLILLLLPVFAEGQNWQWATGSVGSSVNAWPITIDNNGDVFVCGIYYDVSATSITFGAYSIPDNGSVAGSQGQVVFAKYDRWGNVLWAHGTQHGDAYPIGITTDKNGNFYIFGAFETDTLQIGSFVLTNNLTSSLSYDYRYFIAKYDKNGNILWAKEEGNAPLFNNNYSYSNILGIVLTSVGGIATDSSGNVYITTSYHLPTMSIGSFTLSNTNQNEPEVFLAKYDPSGNVLWAKNMAIGGTDMPYALTTGPDAAIYITGTFSSSSLIFGTNVINNPTPGNAAIFIAQFDSSGNPVWAKSGGTGNQYASGLATDASGNLYVTGTFSDTTLTFGTMSINSPHPGSGCSFLAKFSITGDPLWYKTCYGDNYITGYSVATDLCGNVWMSGGFGSNSLNVGGWYSSYVTIAGSTLYNPYFGESFFLAGYDPSGNVIGDSVVPLGSGTQDGIACDRQGNVYLLNNSAVAPIIPEPNDFTSENSLVLVKYAPRNIIYDTSYLSRRACVIPPANIQAPPGYYNYIWNTGTTGYLLPVYDSSGTMWVYAYGELPCTSMPQFRLLIDTFSLVNNSAFFSLGNDTSICGNYTLKIQVSNADYLWQNNSTASSYTVTHAGVYYATASKDGCSYTDTVTITNGICNNNIVFFPNPTSSVLNISSTENINNITITSFLSQIVLQKRMTGNNCQVDISGFPVGMYFVTVKTDGQQYVKKIVKE